MKLIRDLGTRRAGNGQTRRWGLFLCPYCNKEVERQYHAGLSCKSCGCAHGKLVGEGHVKHGYARKNHQTRLYILWKNMKKRCYYPDDPGYKNYGGRGIIVCDEWLNDFITFKEWALSNKYKNNLTIDRINNNGSYKPNNCRWATRTVQNRNSRNTKLTMKKANQVRSLYFNVKISQRLLARIFGVSCYTIWCIINNKTWG